MVRKVYEDNKQYGTVAELEKAVQKAWNEINIDYIKNLVNSMPERMKLMFKNDGKAINY